MPEGSRLPPARSQADSGCELLLEPLRGEDIARSYPLVRDFARKRREISLEQWTKQVRASVQARQTDEVQRGLLAARSPNGCILGLCCYQIAADRAGGWRLSVDDVIVPAIFGQRRIEAALFRALEHLAHAQGTVLATRKGR